MCEKRVGVRAARWRIAVACGALLGLFAWIASSRGDRATAVADADADGDSTSAVDAVVALTPPPATADAEPRRAVSVATSRLRGAQPTLDGIVVSEDAWRLSITRDVPGRVVVHLPREFVGVVVTLHAETIDDGATAAVQTSVDPRFLAVFDLRFAGPARLSLDSARWLGPPVELGTVAPSERTLSFDARALVASATLALEAEPGSPPLAAVTVAPRIERGSSPRLELGAPETAVVVHFAAPAIDVVVRAARHRERVLELTGGHYDVVLAGGIAVEIVVESIDEFDTEPSLFVGLHSERCGSRLWRLTSKRTTLYLPCAGRWMVSYPSAEAEGDGDLTEKEFFVPEGGPATIVRIGS